MVIELPRKINQLPYNQSLRFFGTYNIEAFVAVIVADHFIISEAFMFGSIQHDLSRDMIKSMHLSCTAFEKKLLFCFLKFLSHRRQSFMIGEENGTDPVAT